MGILELQTLFFLTILVTSSLSYFGTFCLVKKTGARSDLSFESKKKKIISWINCFSAGVLMGMCFFGMMPAAAKKWNEVMEDQETMTHVPWPEVTMLLGFLLIFTLQHSFSKSLPPNGCAGGKLNESDSQKDNYGSMAIGSDQVGEKTVNEEETLGTFKVFFLMLAVSWHNVLEGLSLGLQRDPATATHLFIGILAHSLLLASAVTLLSVNVWLRRGWSDGQIIACLTAMVAARPMGTIVGVVLGAAGEDQTSSYSTASAVLQSLSVGLFLHIIFIGVLPTEFPEKRTGTDGGRMTARAETLLKLTLLTAGTAGFLALVVRLPHSH